MLTLPKTLIKTVPTVHPLTNHSTNHLLSQSYGTSPRGKKIEKDTSQTKEKKEKPIIHKLPENFFLPSNNPLSLGETERILETHQIYVIGYCTAIKDLQDRFQLDQTKCTAILESSIQSLENFCFALKAIDEFQNLNEDYKAKYSNLFTSAIKAGYLAKCSNTTDWENFNKQANSPDLKISAPRVWGVFNRAAYTVCFSM